MLGDSVVEAIIQIGKVLKEKVPNLFVRILIILGIALIALTPLTLFDYWIGSIIGLVIVTIVFLFLISLKDKN